MRSSRNLTDAKPGASRPPAASAPRRSLPRKTPRRKKEAEEQAAAEAQAKAAAEAKATEEAQLEELESGCLASMASPGAPQQEEADASVSATSEAIVRDSARVAFAETTQELLGAMHEPLVKCGRAAVIIAAPTPGWSVIGNYMEIARGVGNLYYKEGRGALAARRNCGW